MARVDDVEMGRARQVALSGNEIASSASVFRTALSEFVVSELCADLGLQLQDANSGTAEDFILRTPHGVIDALFDHAFKNGQLAGRYRFFVSDRASTPADTAKLIMTILVNRDRLAAFDPSEPFGWALDMGARNTQAMMGDFVLSLLAHQQATLTTY